MYVSKGMPAGLQVNVILVRCTMSLSANMSRRAWTDHVGTQQCTEPMAGGGSFAQLLAGTAAFKPPRMCAVEPAQSVRLFETILLPIGQRHMQATSQVDAKDRQPVQLQYS